MLRPLLRPAGRLVFAAALVARSAEAAAPTSGPSLVLITLDTTRADHVGGTASATPNLDALAARGARYTRAITAAPLTLPAHCSLLTGLEPPHHGVRDNGLGALPADVPTLASVLRARGYATAAFVASRVLDRRFGLDRGFATYDDRMQAERIGEQGYPERDAAEVTEAALAWLRQRRRAPFFLWVHYYDPHSPYVAPGSSPAAPVPERYRAEVAYVDAQVGRLLAALPAPAARTLVAAVGDHGEMLGEHGERDHGIFLYTGSLHVPLVVAGPRVPRTTVDQTVPARALAATLLHLLGAGAAARPFGDALPGLGLKTATTPPDAAVYSESLLPATAYDWSPLKALTRGTWRLVEAPRPELYDLGADPAEQRNVAAAQPGRVAALRAELQRLEKSTPARSARAVQPDPEVAEALRSLGYLSGASAPAPVARAGSIDPKDGMALLAEFERAKALLQQGAAPEAAALLEDLVRRNPGNVPFLTRLAEASSAMGRREAALATLRRAAQLNPALDFLRLRLAETSFELGRLADARAEYEAVLALDPRSARAWIGLGELALRQGKPDEELALLRRAEAAGTESALVLSRLAQIEVARGQAAAGEGHAGRAVKLTPEFAPAWWVWGEAAEKQARAADAATRFTRAVELGLASPGALLHLGRVLHQLGRASEARPYLERALRSGGPTAAEAKKLLEQSR
jgi:arylsulfatase A-like enzyme/Tfp pilus assembly protein PilF